MGRGSLRRPRALAHRASGLAHQLRSARVAALRAAVNTRVPLREVEVAAAAAATARKESRTTSFAPCNYGILAQLG